MVLLFQNINLVNENNRDERVQAFAETLNNAFKQFQKLWEAHKELLEKRHEYQSSTANVQNIIEDTIGKSSVCRTAEKEKMIPEEESTIENEENDNCDPVVAEIIKTKKSSKPEDSQDFQIFSEDFYTQGLEENFIHQNSLLQEIQNLTPRRAKSPVFGLKKGKIRVQSSPFSSPNLSEKSVVILNDFYNDENSKIENRPITNPISDSDGATRSINSLIQNSSSPASSISVIPTSKNITKWGISTITNVNTEIIAGANKKLKQSKLFIRTEKMTDLSTCDDVYNIKSYDRDQEIRKRGMEKPIGTETNKNVLEDSVIQGSPERDKSLSTICKKITKKNKSFKIIERRFDCDENAVKDTKQSEVRENVNYNVGQTNTDVTIFDPRITSTQYWNLPCCSKSVNGRSPVKDKLDLLKRIDAQGEGANDSNVIDETMFGENRTPTDSRLQKKLSLKKIEKSKKLSLKKDISKNPERVPSNKESSGAKISGKELGVASPPRKKFKDNFDVIPWKNKSPTYAYKGSPVRKQAERALLNGWSCLKCQNYYDAMGLSGEELQKRKNQCSRHRSKFNEKQLTQKDYWNPDFSSSYHSTMWGDD